MAAHHFRPDGHTLRPLLRAERLLEQEAHLVERFLARLRKMDLVSLLSRDGLTIYEIAHVMHLSGEHDTCEGPFVESVCSTASARSNPGLSVNPMFVREEGVLRRKRRECGPH